MTSLVLLKVLGYFEIVLCVAALCGGLGRGLCEQLATARAQPQPGLSQASDP